jgi:arabinofuranosyltransferase
VDFSDAMIRFLYVRTKIDLQQVLILLGWAYLAYLVVRAAWVGDDALITFRSVENFTSGYGPVYNLGQRVQVFTHPLWMLLLSLTYWGLKAPGWATAGSLYFVTVFLSILLSLAAAGWMVFCLARTRIGALVGILLLAASSAYVDYSTSGLENPLSFFLVVVFLLVFLEGFRDENVLTFTPRRMGSLALLASLIGMTRHDLLLLVFPTLIAAWWYLPVSQQKSGFFWALAGVTPFVGWELFSTFYYGFPFPNTAYAKLGADVSQSVLWRQGFLYFLDSCQFDPVTLPVIFIALAIGFQGKYLNRKLSLPLVGGILLYLVYVFHIGGDFMSGRFFSVPFLAAVCLLTQVRLTNKRAAWLIPIVASLAALILPLLGIVRGADYSTPGNPMEMIGNTGIVSERAFYYRYSGLLRVLEHHLPPSSPYSGSNWKAGMRLRQVAVVDVAGKPGLEAGPDVHVVDRWAITDPLLARLPSVHRTQFRIGHFERDLPQGYIESLETNKNLVSQPSLAVYYDHLNLIVSGDLWLPGRFVEILKINFGGYQKYLAEYADTIRRIR